MIVSEYFSPVLAGAGVIDYFIDSNFAGKLVIFVLVFLNCWAIAIMLNKFFDLKKSDWLTPVMKKESIN